MKAEQSPPFGTQLRRYRAARGLTQEELAERARLSPRGIRALESGERSAPRRDTVELLADALALTPEERESFKSASRAPAPTQTYVPPQPTNARAAPWVRRRASVAGALALCLVVVLIGALALNRVLSHSPAPPLTGLGAAIPDWGRGSVGRLSYPIAVAVATDGDLFVLDRDGNRVRKYASDGTPLLSWGGTGTAPGSFLSPAAIAIDREGRVYVADTGNNRVQVFTPAGIWRASLPIPAPGGVTIASRGDIYVSDPTGNRIDVFSSDGRRLSTWTGRSLNAPTGLATDAAGRLYVKTGDGRIEVLSSQGGVLRSWPTFAPGPGNLAVSPSGTVWQVEDDEVAGFSSDGSVLDPRWAFVSQYPEDMAFDAHGNAYIADAGSHDVERFTRSGTLVARIGRAGSSAGALSSPNAIAIDPSGAVYVADARARIVKFAPDGAIDGVWRVPGLPAGAGPRGLAVDDRNRVYLVDGGANRVWVLDASGKTIAVWGHEGAAPGALQIPTGLAIGSTGDVYVADSGNARIDQFTGHGKYLRSFDVEGAANGQRPVPTALTVGPDGAMYVADAFLDTVMKLSSSGEFLAAWGSAGASPGHFRSPQGITLGAAGQLYVADTANNRVQVLSRSGDAVQSVMQIGGQDGSFSHPSSVAVDHRGDVYVADTGKNRIVKFLPKRLRTT